jgi:glycine betaine/proline transport system substrate-binding protein
MQHKFLTAFFLLLTVLFSSCSHEHAKKIEVIHFEWDADLIMADIVASVLTDRLGYQVQMVSATPAAAWAAIGAGMADAVIGTWLPVTHGAYFESMENRVDVLNKVTEGVKIGIAVPSYASIDSIPELKQEAARFQHKVYGIEPGAGIMVRLEASLKHYGLDDFEIVEGSEAIMLAALSEATEQQKWTAITAWSPHPMFQMEEIKYLEDPDNTFGEQEYIAFLGRKNLSKDMPDAYHFLSNFKIDLQDIETMQYQMLIQHIPRRELTQRWLKAHSKEIFSWIGDNPQS